MNATYDFANNISLRARTIVASKTYTPDAGGYRLCDGLDPLDVYLAAVGSPFTTYASSMAFTSLFISEWEFDRFHAFNRSVAQFIRDWADGTITDLHAALGVAIEMKQAA